MKEKCGLFSDFQYGFRSSRSTADLPVVVSDKIARAFNKSGATRAVALDISKALDRDWHAGHLYKLKFYGISGHIFGLISSFLSNGLGSFLVLHFSCCILMTFLMFLNWSSNSFYAFFLLRLLCISINLPYAHAWNIVVTSGLVALVATWNC